MKHATAPTPMPPNTQNFRTPQPSPIGEPFRGVFDGVYESSAAHHRRTRSTQGRHRLTSPSLHAGAEPVTNAQPPPPDQKSEWMSGRGMNSIPS